MDEYPKKSPESWDEKTIDCVWCWDSETGEKVLMDRKTNKEIGRWTRQTLTES